MCNQHKHLQADEWVSLHWSSWFDATIASPVTQIENKIITEIPEWSSDEQITRFTDKVKDLFKSIF